MWYWSQFSLCVMFIANYFSYEVDVTFVYAWKVAITLLAILSLWAIYPLLIYSNGNVILYSKCQQVKSGNRKICHTVVSSAQANNLYTCMFAHLNLKHVHRKLLRSLVEAWIRYISYFPTRKILGRVRMKSASMMSIFSCKRAIRHMADLQHKASRCWLIEKLKRPCVSLAAC